MIIIIEMVTIVCMALLFTSLYSETVVS